MKGRSKSKESVASCSRKSSKNTTGRPSFASPLIDDSADMTGRGKSKESVASCSRKSSKNTTGRPSFASPLVDDSADMNGGGKSPASVASCSRQSSKNTAGRQSFTAQVLDNAVAVRAKSTSSDTAQEEGRERAIIGNAMKLWQLDTSSGMSSKDRASSKERVIGCQVSFVDPERGEKAESAADQVPEVPALRPPPDGFFVAWQEGREQQEDEALAASPEAEPPRTAGTEVSFQLPVLPMAAMTPRLQTPPSPASPCSPQSARLSNARPSSQQTSDKPSSPRSARSVRRRPVMLSKHPLNQGGIVGRAQVGATPRGIARAQAAAMRVASAASERVQRDSGEAIPAFDHVRLNRPTVCSRSRNGQGQSMFAPNAMGSFRQDQAAHSLTPTLWQEFQMSREMAHGSRSRQAVS
eukprot:gb/GFBE01070745.1/.p1 GENE.gb/GFBE01070745.1/~~gb/GFBE01070745.1/.p1  ORF type:complete len:411 (+),score=56.60 gb/GFBE01070745.1/:1-1233(+)